MREREEVRKGKREGGREKGDLPGVTYHSNPKQALHLGEVLLLQDMTGLVTSECVLRSHLGLLHLDPRH